MEMPTFGEWERTVLEYTYDLVDHISMHAYYHERDGDRASFLGSGTSMDRFIERVVASADAVGAQARSDKRITISFDEWNVWYQSRFPGEDNLPIQKDAPRIIEDVYSALDAVVVGDLLVTLLNHADRVPVACLAQLVNVIAPIMTEPGGEAWRQPTFHPFATTARLAQGEALDLRVSTSTITTKAHGDVPAVTAAATLADGAVALFLTNRSAEPVEVELAHLGAALEVAEGWAMTADHEAAVVGPEHAEKVATEHWGEFDVAGRIATGDDATTKVTLAPESWTALSGTLKAL
jgi:alpha-N-arabinofuranosidase